MADYNLPDAELDVLACLYRLENATVRQIREAIKKYRPMTHGSAVTLLKRLEEKSLVTKQLCTRRLPRRTHPLLSSTKAFGIPQL